MSALPPPFDWSRRLQCDWTSQEGLNKLKDIVGPLLKYDPQLYDSSRILNGTHVFCISATGDGKLALIFIPTLARPKMITIVIKSTNFLETDMAESLHAKGVTVTVVNAETLAAATQSNHDLWKEARECQYQVITLSPESLQSDEFKGLRQDGRFRARRGVVVVDKWSRKSFANIWTL